MKNAYTRREVMGFFRVIRRLTALCIALAVAFITMTVLYFTKPTVKQVTEDKSNSQVQNTSSTASKDKEAANLAKDLQNWNLVLVNK